MILLASQVSEGGWKRQQKSSWSRSLGREPRPGPSTIAANPRRKRRSNPHLNPKECLVANNARQTMLCSGRNRAGRIGGPATDTPTDKTVPAPLAVMGTECCVQYSVSVHNCLWSCGLAWWANAWASKQRRDPKVRAIGRCTYLGSVGKVGSALRQVRYKKRPVGFWRRSDTLAHTPA
ncbi:hypothetical protein LX36DRAFT_456280 [Colletotrichum falcatum]|nr:hypothetical protein LX36DRAFT_456280 [Colletotrichum falcatum]